MLGTVRVAAFGEVYVLELWQKKLKVGVVSDQTKL